MDASVTLLRPSLRRRIPFFVLAVLLFALMVAGLVYSPLLGVVGVLIFGFAVVNGALRLFHPRSYATELDDDEFRSGLERLEAELPERVEYALGWVVAVGHR